MTETQKGASTPSTMENGHGISFDEMRVLLDYTIRHGLDQECTFVNSLGKKLAEETAAKANSPSIESVCLYAKLCMLTKPITGRSLRLTSEVDRYLRSIVWLAVLFLVIVVANESLTAVYLNIEPGKDPSFPFILQRYILNPVAPFIWGALGSCVFLLKRLSDLAAAGAFNRHKLKGWQTRIVLGAVLGGLMQFIFNADSFSGDKLYLGANAVAFITGVGVRVVYGAIEKAVALLAEKLDLKGLSQGSRNLSVISWLNEQLAKTSASEEIEKHKLLTELLNEINKPKPNV